MLAAQASPADRNKPVARAFFEEVLGQGKLDHYKDSHCADFVAHAGARNATADEDLGFAVEERKALLDMSVRVEKTVLEKDMVAVYWFASEPIPKPAWACPRPGRRSMSTA